MLTRLASVSGTLAQTSLVADFGGFLQVCTIKVSHSGGSLHEFHQKSCRVNPSLRQRCASVPKFRSLATYAVAAAPLRAFASHQLREKYCLRPNTKPLNGMSSAP